MRICFFARVADPRLIQKISFYADDVRALEELGHEVVVVRHVRDIPLNCDVYFAWWPGWGTVPVLLSRLLNRPSVVVGGIHYQDSKYGYGRRSWIQRAAIRWTLRAADVSLPMSSLELEGHRRLAARDARLVYHGTKAPASAPGWNDRKPIVFSIGHMNRLHSIDRKGYDNVVRAIPIVRAAVPDVRFVMAGTTGGEFFLDRLAESLGVRDSVEFPGQIDNATRDHYLNESRCFAQPAEWEGFGVAQLESMSHGLPVVTSDAGAVREVVGDAGLYCNKQSPMDIASQLIRLLTDRPLWECCATLGRERATSLFSFERRKQAIGCILNELVAQSSKQSAPQFVQGR